MKRLIEMFGHRIMKIWRIQILLRKGLPKRNIAIIYQRDLACNFHNLFCIKLLSLCSMIMPSLIHLVSCTHRKGKCIARLTL